MQHTTNHSAWRTFSYAHMHVHTCLTAHGAWAGVCGLKLRACDGVWPTKFGTAGLGLYPCEQPARISEEPVSPTWCFVLNLLNTYMVPFSTGDQHLWILILLLYPPRSHPQGCTWVWMGQNLVPNTSSARSISANSAFPWMLQCTELHGFQHRIHITPAECSNLHCARAVMCQLRARSRSPPFWTGVSQSTAILTAVPK